ncbi:SDR family NAD(P)-dependent oxidoreductase [Litorivicinus lipolyticus]|uniref:SDR family NAD(P)-dependent oxidoreductase n=1 Tax=Litorivicinus lipolyticus TaxID=418701 RepID=A0A5Q2Q650_9GAMM|nr:SDR family NAD(P)-dependent oxidoreductase [Litorivicinus lipolyticus]QGG79639.1 SDR family NAD(P)-dependent oxidoreductase [Litorivicinus lipolyticus]
MTLRVLITGATDGIGKVAAAELIAAGHQVWIHGRDPDKLGAVADELGTPHAWCCDLSDLVEVKLAHGQLAQTFDVLVNNAGVFKTPQPRTDQGLDARFAVNTIAPLMLAQAVIKGMPDNGRIVNLSSAAQAPVDLDALAGRSQLADDFQAYAQSKLAITQWTAHLAIHVPQLCVAVNPGSLLATKMVTEGFGVAGSDVRQGSDIIVRAATGDEFLGHSGEYFDNDAGHFAPAHPNTADVASNARVFAACDALAAVN